MAELINGKEISSAVKERIKSETARLITEKGITPGLAVIIAGDDPASQIYVRNKEKACAELGMYSEKYALKEDTTTEEITALIKRLNCDEKIHGILCQLPLPAHIDEKAVINAISPAKDVDAFHPENAGRIMTGDPLLLPCTPAGVMEMLRYMNIEVAGERCVIVGRSNIVGKPMAMLMLKADATVTVCHTKTRDLEKICREADILIASAGKKKLITADMVKDGAVVIDVGINRDENGKLCGDVDFVNVEPKCSYITPVPGGVGPMTIAMLMQNTLTAAVNSEK